jgi:general secretion pathway protein D
MRRRPLQTALGLTLVTALLSAQNPPAQPPATQPAPVAPAETGGFRLQNVSLVELVDILARRLKINYILDPRVKGSVTINTYGEVKPTAHRPAATPGNDPAH